MRAPNFLLVLLASVFGMAQPLPVALNFNQTQTFGMVGVAFNQTARLNVLNMATPSPEANPVAPPPCKVMLQIFDDQATKLQEFAIDNLAPGKAMHVDYPRLVGTSPGTPLRVQVRGVIVTTSTPGTGTVIPPTRVFPVQTCSLVSTLEVFDNDTGRTLVILTNPALIPNYVLPLL